MMPTKAKSNASESKITLEAKCRPFMFAGELEGKLWFCTNNQKDVYKDMQANPEIEISVSSPEYA